MKVIDVQKDSLEEEEQIKVVFGEDGEYLLFINDPEDLYPFVIFNSVGEAVVLSKKELEDLSTTIDEVLNIYCTTPKD